MDPHQRYITACAQDDDGQLVAEHRRLAPEVGVLVAWLQALCDAVTVAMEATLYWAWLPDPLEAAGIAAGGGPSVPGEADLAGALQADSIDVRKLAELLRTHLLPVIWVPDVDIRARRKLLRGRAYLVRLRTSVKNRIHGHLTAENCRTGLTDLYGKAGRAWLAVAEVSPMGRLQIDLLLEVVDTLDERIRRLDERVQRLVKADPVAARLQTWPGIGPALLLAEIGTIDRFSSAHELTAYAGLTPSTPSSGDKTRHSLPGVVTAPTVKSRDSWGLDEVEVKPPPTWLHCCGGMFEG